VVVTSAKAERRGNFRRGVSSRVDCTGAGAISSGLCINPAQDALNCLERKIFDGGFSRSAARQIFQSMISPRRQLPQFHRPAADSLAGRPNIRRRIGFVDRETNSIHRSRNGWRISGLSSHGDGGIAGNLEVHPDFRRCSPPAKS